MVQAFHANLESKLQSSKFENLKLHDPFDLKIKILGHELMKKIREKEEKKLKNLNLPNYGLNDLYDDSMEEGQFEIAEKSYFFEAPKILSPCDNENDSRPNCLISSIIMGRLAVSNHIAFISNLNMPSNILQVLALPKVFI
jgi:hypothetical protein